MRQNYHTYILVVLFTVFTGTITSAHEIRPAYLQIDEQANHIHVLWKQPTMGEVGIRINPVISSIALPDSTATVSVTEVYLIKEWNLLLPNTTLDQCTITINGL